MDTAAAQMLDPPDRSLRWSDTGMVNGARPDLTGAMSPSGFALRVHDLVQLASADIERACTAKPEWVDYSLQEHPWAVVRRARRASGLVAIGVRGTTRQQRWGGFVWMEHIVQVLPPYQLRASLASGGRDLLRAFQSLRILEAMLKPESIEWGPGGSVGFELATGVPVVTTESDLDLILRAPMPFNRKTARMLWEQMAAVAAGLDVLVETPYCGLSLEEYALSRQSRFLLRTENGPVLASDPWNL